MFEILPKTLSQPVITAGGFHSFVSHMNGRSQQRFILLAENENHITNSQTQINENNLRCPQHKLIFSVLGG